jgi:hypothetical protein
LIVFVGLTLCNLCSFKTAFKEASFLYDILFSGPYGTNHGIEIHDDVVNYANKKLEEFRKKSPALDEYEFCEPKFVKGMVLQEVQQF